MIEFQDYSKIYPRMPLDLCLFFDDLNVKDSRVVAHKTIMGFCSYYKTIYNDLEIPQPRIVSKICDILCEKGKLSLFKKDGLDNLNSTYMVVLTKEVKTDKDLQYYYNKRLSYLIYGFKYIYEEYRKYVLPIEYTNRDGRLSLGTSFLFKHGLVTAKHCIQGAKKISIQGIPKENLESASFEIHENEIMDLLYIRFKNPIIDSIVFSKNAEVLDEVMTLGYPLIAGYHNFLNAENATISARFTASVGQVTAEAEDIWIKEKLLLITAKIKGGNSGGPIIANDGSIIGVSVNLALGDGDYDELGYGTVIPISFVNDIIDSTDKKYLNVNKIGFKNFG